MRGVKNFAYDLDMIPGAVNSRVVLLLRSIEAKPWHLIFERNLPIIYSARRVLEGVMAGRTVTPAVVTNREGNLSVQRWGVGGNPQLTTGD